jgi:hypothetical protein
MSFISIYTEHFVCPRVSARFWENDGRSETKPVSAFREFTDE